MTGQFRVTYSPAALDDLKAVYSYIAFELHSPIAAKGQASRIRSEIRSLDQFPERYSVVDWEPWASMEMRKVPIDNYVAYYLTDLEKRTVTIERIFYGGRDVEQIVRELDD